MAIKFNIFSTVLLTVFFASADAFSRDINLDAIYVNRNSRFYDKLLEKKLTAYQIAGSQFIARDVIFAFWNGGHSVLYVKELPELNIIYSYNRARQTSSELLRINGTITAAKISANGKYLFLKRLQLADGPLPRGETVEIDLQAKKIKLLEPRYPFMDFSLSAGGNGLLFETEKGIVEYSPELNVKTLIIGKSEYAGITRANSPTIAYQSPNRKKTILISGSGGSYRAMILAQGGSWPVSGITSASEIYWMDNARAIFRKGSAGNYSVHSYDTGSRRSTVMAANSLNTNLQFSTPAKVASFLHDQVIHVYDARTNAVINTAIEGEDVFFSPDGSRFISLYLKKLFISNLHAIKKKNLELVKNSREMIGLYRQIINTRSDWSNEYSPEYLRRKTAVYNKIAE